MPAAEPLSRDQYLVARRLATDAATGEIARALRERAQPWILLKGPAVAARLYRDGTYRHHGDIDVFVPRPDYEATAAVVAGLGYVPDPRLPRGQFEHADTWRRSRDGAVVDLHHSIPHVGVEDEDAWAAFSAGPEELVVAGESVTVLGSAAFALLMALHALHHAPEGGRPFVDLERAVTNITLDDWRQARSLAAQLGAERNLAAALTLVDGGQNLHHRLGLPRVPRWEIRLRAGAVVRLATPVTLVLQTRGLRAKLRVIRSELFPSRETRPLFESRYSSRSMVLVFVRRIGHFVVKAPLAIAVWYIEKKDKRAR